MECLLLNDCACYWPVALALASVMLALFLLPNQAFADVTNWRNKILPQVNLSGRFIFAKSVHFFTFVALSFLVFGGLQARLNCPIWVDAAVAFAIPASFGAFTEIVQPTWSTRGYSTLDVFINASGALIGMCFFLLYLFLLTP